MTKAGWQEGTFHVERRIVRGTGIIVTALLKTTQGGGQINTAYIDPQGRPAGERLNATFRQRLSCLGRCTRALARRQETLQAGMYGLGSVYNFCAYPDSLTQPLAGHGKTRRTPAMAAGLTDHRWTVGHRPPCGR